MNVNIYLIGNVRLTAATSYKMSPKSWNLFLKLAFI